MPDFLKKFGPFGGYVSKKLGFGGKVFKRIIEPSSTAGIVCRGQKTIHAKNWDEKRIFQWFEGDYKNIWNISQNREMIVICYFENSYNEQDSVSIQLYGSLVTSRSLKSVKTLNGRKIISTLVGSPTTKNS